MSTYAPIVLFVYNRPLHTQQTVEALLKNKPASESDLFIYSDGAKSDNDEKVEEVRTYLKTIKGFKSVKITEREHNIGLADNIIDGVTNVVNNYGKVIVLEDDLITSAGFLKYMNDALEVYKNEEKVMHISGYMYPYKNKNLKQTFFYPLPSPWGWATWKRAWGFYENDTKKLYDTLTEKNLWDSFNTDGGGFFKQQLLMNLNGKLKTWFVKWHAVNVIKKGLTLFPSKTLTSNEGFDGTGVHCGYSDRYNSELAKSIKVKKQNVILSTSARKIIHDFYGNYIRKTGKYYFRKVIKSVIPYKFVKRIFRKILINVTPELRPVFYREPNWDKVVSTKTRTTIGANTKIYPNYRVIDSEIGDYTYISENSIISESKIGKFCSIGPNFICGWGIHPTNGISTSPMFYSLKKQNGVTLAKENKIEERRPIVIGNDVFIGANVTVLDGVTIGDGAVIGAGAVVSKDIPPFAIAVGVPIKIVNYRFTDIQIQKLLEIKWWDFDDEKLNEVEVYLFDIDGFIKRNKE